MRFCAVILLFFVSLGAIAQKQETKLEKQINRFHQLLTEPRFYIDQYVDDSLSYGHSNGWIENKKEFLDDLGTRIVYHTFKADSMRVARHGKVAYARFSADIEATLDGKRSRFHLRVLEVWVKKGNSWKLFARQAIK